MVPNQHSQIALRFDGFLLALHDLYRLLTSLLVLLNEMVSLVPSNSDAADVGSLLLEPFGHTEIRDPFLDLLIDGFYEGRPTGVAAREDWG